MNRKLLWAVILLLALGGVAIFAMRLLPSFYKEEMKLSVMLEDVKSFVVNDGMTVVYKDGIWCSQDDDYYPVNNVTVDDFFKTLKNAALHADRSVRAGGEKNQITLLLNNGDKINLWFDDENGRTDKVAAVYENESKLLYGDFVLPSQPYQWFAQPLINLDDDEIEEISGVDPHDFSFKDLIFYQVAQKADFADWMSKEIKVVLKNGVVINATIFAQGHSYWVRLNLDTSIMPTAEAYEFVKNNGFLYDGWYFELPQPIGSRLFGMDQV